MIAASSYLDGSIAGLYNYWVVIFLMMTGFYIVLARKNLIKMVIGLNIFQTSVFLLYITIGKVRGGTAPIIPPAYVEPYGKHGDDAAHAAADTAVILYSNPLPSVLMLTAIVVGVATMALALSLVVRIREDYGTIEEDQIMEIERQATVKRDLRDAPTGPRRGGVHRITPAAGSDG